MMSPFDNNDINSGQQQDRPRMQQMLMHRRHARSDLLKYWLLYGPILLIMVITSFRIHSKAQRLLYAHSFHEDFPHRVSVVRIRQGLLDGNYSNQTWDSILHYARLCNSQRASDDEEELRRKVFFPQVDVVVTWVNGSDPDRLRVIDQYNNNEPKGKKLTDQQIKMRFADNQELRIALRSIYKNLPWVRRIFVVTPTTNISWLDPRDDRVKVINDKDIFEHQEYLPSFNSMAVESQLHRIPGLADKYIEMNDDLLFGAPVWPHDFWTLQDDATGQCQPNYIYRCVKYDGRYSKPTVPKWQRAGPFYSAHANVLKVFHQLMNNHTNNNGQGGNNHNHNKTGPPIPFHLPVLIDRTVMEEMVAIPDFARAIDEVAQRRFRDLSHGFMTKYAFQTYLLQWPQNTPDLSSSLLNDDHHVVPKKYRTTMMDQLDDSVYYSVGFKNTTDQLALIKKEWKRGTKFWCMNDVRYAKQAVPLDELQRLDRAILEFFQEHLPAAPWELDDHLSTNIKTRRR